jgi:hypothetical protein
MHLNSQSTEEELRKCLEALVVDNADLERLESLANQFNIFEVIGAVRQELRHSDFLAYLLNPQQSHGLGDIFVRKLLQRVISKINRPSITVSAVDLDIWNVEASEVFREWQNIDILFVNEANGLVVAIENKIATGEHSDQLERYWQTLRHAHPGKRILGLYLTPDGEEPSHPEFLPVDYGQIASLVEDLASNRQLGANPDVRTLLLHYAQMLRRHIVSESEIAELCQRIYRKHKQALDLIYNHRPDHIAARGEFLRSLIRSCTELAEDFSSKAYIRFTLKNWESAKLKAGQGWTKSGRMLLFEFQNFEDSLKLKLLIGPGPDKTREIIFQCAVNNQPPFKPQAKTLNKQWNEIYSANFLSAKFLEDSSEDEIRRKIEEHWQKFLQNDAKVVSTLINSINELFD